MPNRNGTGPEGRGPKTGRGLGSCGDGTPRGGGQGRGLGLRRNVQKEKASKDKEN